MRRRDLAHDGALWEASRQVDAVAARLREGFAGELIGREDPTYDVARAVWNAMVDRRPVLIARCTTTSDVAASLRAAREEGLEIAVRCGGHSVAGHSVCDGGVVIDLGAMRGAAVDTDVLRVSAQGGALLGDLDRATQALGLATPAGIVSHTGIGGLALGGGFGWLSRLHGLTCDNLLAAEVVTATGDVVGSCERRRGPRAPLGAPRWGRELRCRDAIRLPGAPAPEARLDDHARVRR